MPVNNPALDEIADKVFALESSRGKNDGCVTKGRGFNGFGYRQNTREWICFDSYETVKGYVMDWFDEKLATMDLATSLCYYNTGHKINNCPYWENYQTL